jgi:hypothetical protein
MNLHDPLRYDRQDDPISWARAIDQLLSDVPDRLRMGRTASQRAVRFSSSRMFEAFWDTHYNVVQSFASKAEAVTAEESASH